MGERIKIFAYVTALVSIGLMEFWLIHFLVGVEVVTLREPNILIALIEVIIFAVAIVVIAYELKKKVMV